MPRIAVEEWPPRSLSSSAMPVTRFYRSYRGLCCRVNARLRRMLGGAAFINRNHGCGSIEDEYINLPLSGPSSAFHLARLQITKKAVSGCIKELPARL